MKKRKKIPNVSKPNGSRIPTAELPKSNVTFDFQYKNWLQSFKKGEFTTFLKDSDEYADFITQILTELIPKITKDWEPGKQGFKHCLNTKRNCIGIELDKNYFKIGSERLEKHLETLDYKPEIVYNLK